MKKILITKGDFLELTIVSNNDINTINDFFNDEKIKLDKSLESILQLEWLSNIFSKETPGLLKNMKKDLILFNYDKSNYVLFFGYKCSDVLELLNGIHDLNYDFFVKSLKIINKKTYNNSFIIPINIDEIIHESDILNINNLKNKNKYILNYIFHN